MTTAGWIFMLTSWGVIAAVTAYCYYNLFLPQEKSGEVLPPTP